MQGMTWRTPPHNHVAKHTMIHHRGTQLGKRTLRLHACHLPFLWAARADTAGPLRAAGDMPVPGRVMPLALPVLVGRFLPVLSLGVLPVPVPVTVPVPVPVLVLPVTLLTLVLALLLTSICILRFQLLLKVCIPAQKKFNVMQCFPGTCAMLTAASTG